MQRLNSFKPFLFFTLALLVMASSAMAHPHVWVDLRVKPVMNQQGELLGLQQAWRFDPFYSLVLIEELERGGPKNELEARYDQLAVEIINNLSGVNFFTQAKINDIKSNWKPVIEYTLLRVGQRIEMRFFMPLMNPLVIDKKQAFSYQVYDPTYYIEMLHALESGIDKTGLSNHCKITLESPNPSADLIEKALSLDKTEIADDPQLGLYFAEKVTLECLN